MDTIFALASGQGKAGVAVVRISGPAAYQSFLEFAAPIEPRRASLRSLRLQGEIVDQALALYFPGPGSFTGEDVDELHLHGSIAVVQTVLKALGDMHGLRQAEAGEFTRRALENERLDLTQVEGLADLIEAETEAQRRQAVRVLSGEFGERASAWREKLIRAAALIEATIDFADEDVPVDVSPEVLSLINDVAADLRCQEAGASAAERIRDGFEVAIVGPPNAGKSTLLNALAGRDAAITSEIAGTTRDVLEVRMDLRGLPATILDTAGIRESVDQIEEIGIQRALDRAAKSDLRIILCPRGEVPVLEPTGSDLILAPKADVQDGDFSAKTGAGLSEVIDSVADRLAVLAHPAGLAIRERHRVAIASGLSSLDMASLRLSRQPELAELIAEDIRSAIRALDSLVGRVGAEDVLDEIFLSFCIGK
jgi:tRNA modification GTPase